MDEDVKLMLQLKEGDEKAFDKILDKYEKKLINFIFRFTGNKWDAEELTQEVFLRIYKAAQNYEPITRFSTWIYRIAVNAGIDYKRKKQRDAGMRAELSIHDAVETEEGEMNREVPDLNAGQGVETAPEQAQLDETVRDALACIPPKQRIALVLRVYEEKSYEEISRIMGISKSSVESLIFRARQGMKEKLKYLN